MSANPRPTEAIRLAAALGVEFGGADVQRHHDDSMTVTLTIPREDAFGGKPIDLLDAVLRECPGRAAKITKRRDAMDPRLSHVEITVAAPVEG